MSATSLLVVTNAWSGFAVIMLAPLHVESALYVQRDALPDQPGVSLRILPTTVCADSSSNCNSLTLAPRPIRQTYRLLKKADK